MYCTIEDILKELDKLLLIELVNDENKSPDEIDLEDEESNCVIRINEQIKNASDEIDGYLAGKYPTPLSIVPNLIKLVCKDIAIYNLYKRRHRLDMPESITQIYNYRVKLLDQIQKGNVQLGLSPNPTTGENVIKINKIPEDRLFGKDVLDTF